MRRGICALGIALMACAILLGVEPAHAHGIDPNSAKALSQGGLLAFFEVGAKHMLTGYDHLLFLFGVMFFLTSVREIFIYITAFTLGHSATLISATLAGIRANYFLVDAAIAISVIYKGFDNLDGFRRGFGVRAPNLLAMVFIFGLIHGFGLSTRFQNIGLPKDGLFGRLLSFNAGVELGQLAALIAMVAVLAVFRRSGAFDPLSRIANVGLMICGSLLFLMQVHGYLHTTYPEDFGFNSIEHWLDHYENKTESDGSEEAPPESAPTTGK